MISPNGNRIDLCTGAIAGVVAAVPARETTNDGWQDAIEASKMTGVLARRIASPGQTTEDLCLAAARALMAELDWEPSTVDALVYVTQTPGMAVPSSAFSLHRDLRLPQHCPALEVNWSCSGYVYGLWLAMKLSFRRVLLLVGDTSSAIVDRADRATAPVFGDAGSATAVVTDYRPVTFVLGGDGKDGDRLSQLPGQYLKMDGPSVFSFTLRVVPGLVDDVLSAGPADLLLFHQANRYMLRTLAKKCGLLERFTPLQIPSNIEEFGNCSSASIPLLIATDVAVDAQPVLRPQRNLALFGYGAGWAWAGALLHTDDLRVSKLIEVS